MTRELFRRYVWLVDTVKNGKKMTFDEISRAWDISSFNVDHSKLALRTFHNHRDAIEQLFGISIFCDRSDHRYYIPEGTTDSTNLKLWMLQSLSFNHLVKKEGKSVENRIVVDETPEQKFGIISIIDAMIKSVACTFSYPDDTCGGKKEVVIEPYGLRFCENVWYVLGKELNSKLLKVYELKKMGAVELTDHKFRFPQGFSLQAYFSRYIGGEIDDSRQPVRIMLRANGKGICSLDNSPLSRHQREIEAGDGYSIYEVDAVPTAQLAEKLMLMSPEVVVLLPESLRRTICRKAEEIASLYQTAE